MTAFAFWNPGDQLIVWGVNVLLQVTLVTVIALACTASIRLSSAARYWLLCTSLMLVMLIPTITFVMQSSGRSFVPVSMMQERAAATAVTEVQTTSVDAPQPDDGSSFPTSHGRFDDASNHARGSTPGPFIADGRETDDFERDDAEASIAHSDRQPSVTWSGTVLRIVMPPLLFVWLAGAAFFFVRLTIGCYRLATILSSAKPNTDASLAELFRSAGQALRVERMPELLLSNRVSGPIATGVFRPRVVLPEQMFDKVTAEQLRDILVHEVSHVVRRDQIVVLLQNLVAAMLWLHPLVKAFNRKLAQSREEVCDNFVLAATDAPSYSHTLLTLAELIQIERPLPGTAGLFTSRWKLESRIAGLLDENRNRTTRVPAPGRLVIVAVSLVMAAGAALGTMTLADGKIQKQDSQTKTTPGTSAVSKPTAKSNAADKTRTDRLTIRTDELDASEWQEAIQSAKDHLGTFRHRYTLFRVLTADERSDARVQLKAIKLKKLTSKYDGGGGTYRSERTGAFVLWQHIKSAVTKDGKDPLEVGAFGFGRETLWVDVPQAGTVQVLGDIVLETASPEARGSLQIDIDPNDIKDARKLVIGPIVAGGPFGRSITIEDGKCRIPELPAGTYKLLLPEFDVKKSRWDVTIKPRTTTHLMFVVESATEIVKAEESFAVDDASKAPQDADKTPNERPTPPRKSATRQRAKAVVREPPFVAPARVLHSADEAAEFPQATLACKLKMGAITETEKNLFTGTKCAATCRVISPLKGDVGDEVQIMFIRNGNGMIMPGADAVQEGEVYVAMLRGDGPPYQLFAAMKAVDGIVEPTLGTKPGDRLMAELLAMCKSNDLTMRIAAIQQIGIMRDSRGGNAVNAAAKNVDDHIARAAVIAQYRMKITPDAKRVMELFNAQIMDVWYQESGKPQKDAQGTWIFREEGRVRIAERGLPDFDYATYVREGIKHDWVLKGEHSLYVFFGIPWKVQRKACVPELVKLLEHPDERVQWWAVTCLSHTVEGRHEHPEGRDYQRPADKELKKWRTWWKETGKAYMAE